MTDKNVLSDEKARYLSVNRTIALIPYGDLALAVTRVVSLKNPIGLRKVSHSH